MTTAKPQARTWTIGAVRLALAAIPREVSAFCSGPWAIHFREDDQDDPSYEGWRLTHIGSGLCAGASLRDDAPARLEALANQLDALGDWSADPIPPVLLARGKKVQRKWRASA